MEKIPFHLRNWLKRQQRKDNDVVLMKEVPSDPRDRLRRRTKLKNDNSYLIFLKVSFHPRDMLKRLQRKHDNVVSVKKRSFSSKR